ncbi:MAG TPA: hypothetical protein VMV17_12285 [Streptosporangiaceae bacterium]|nr:hypothetical protein [Streptosporangiaceae bacterium]
MPTTASQRERTRPAGARPARDGSPARAGGRRDGQDHELTVSIQLERVAAMVTEPVAAAGRVLSSRGGLPVYIGLGVLAAADVVTWPIAAAAGLGYAVLRWWGPSRLPAGMPRPMAGRPGLQPAGQAPAGKQPPASSPGNGTAPASRRAPAAAKRPRTTTSRRTAGSRTAGSRTARAGAGSARTRTARPGSGTRS